MDIEFEKDGSKKTTDEKCTDDLLAIGWKVVKKEPAITQRRVSKKKEK